MTWPYPGGESPLATREKPQQKGKREEENITPAPVSGIKNNQSGLLGSIYIQIHSCGAAIECCYRVTATSRSGVYNADDHEAAGGERPR